MPGYSEVLTAARGKAAVQQSDAEAMAQFCDLNAQVLLGAVSPQLIWEGAQKASMTTKDLLVLIQQDKSAAIDLMWR